MNKKPTENDDLQNALEKTDDMKDGDFGQQEIAEDWSDGLIDDDFDVDFDTGSFERDDEFE